MVKHAAPGEPYSLDDGLGIRRIESDGRSPVEILELAPALCGQPILEQAIRSRASRYADLDIRAFAPVRRVERAGETLRIVSEIPTGIRLSHLLSHLESTGEVVSESAMLELASLVINAVASLHAWPGGIAHGAINPAHMLITSDGRVVLTDCVFGAALEVLQRNRESLWKEFGLAMPAAATLARFDQQADVTQMGAAILAIILQRPMRAHEYPRGVTDLVVTATESAVVSGAAGSSPALRTWLQQALQIHQRLAFRSGVDAQRAFADIGTTPGSRRAGAMALQVLLRTTFGEPVRQGPALNPSQSPAATRGPVDPQPQVQRPRPNPFDSILRAVFEKH